MFGTIGHAHLKSGHEKFLPEMMKEWERDIRPKISGHFISVGGHKEGNTSEMVFMALAKDRATYRKLAEMPEQDAWFRKMMQHVDGQVRWEDVEMDVYNDD